MYSFIETLTDQIICIETDLKYFCNKKYLKRWQNGAELEGKICWNNFYILTKHIIEQARCIPTYQFFFINFFQYSKNRRRFIGLDLIHEHFSDVLFYYILKLFIINFKKTMIIDYAFVLLYLYLLLLYIYIHNIIINYKTFSTSGEYLYSSSLAVLILYSFK